LDVTLYCQPFWFGEVWVGKDWHRFQDLGAHGAALSAAFAKPEKQAEIAMLIYPGRTALDLIGSAAGI
jgi:hypothetical protein